MSALSAMFATEPLVLAEPVLPPAYDAADDAPAEEPQDKRRKTEDSVRQRPAVRTDRFAEALVMVVDEGVVAGYGDNVEHVNLIRACAGRYYKIGMQEGSPVFRQER